MPVGDGGGHPWFHGHHVIAADIDTDWVARRCRPGDLLAPASPAFVLELAEQLGVAPSSTRLVLRAPADEGKPDLPLDPVIQGSAIPALLARNAIGPRYRCMQRRTDTRS